MFRVPINSVIKAIFTILNDGVGVAGQIPTVVIYRYRDDSYWTGSMWDSTPTSLSMTALVNGVGNYGYSFDLATADPDIVDVYNFYYTNTGVYACNGADVYKTSSEVSGSDLTVTRIANLDQIPTINAKLGSFSGGANDNISDLLKLIYKVEKGKWSINATTHKMTFYDSDNSTPLLVFDLKDSSGQPTSTEPFARIPV
jgi:hypothetical protein